jgi:hypothetical protein
VGAFHAVRRYPRFSAPPIAPRGLFRRRANNLSVRVGATMIVRGVIAADGHPEDASKAERLAAVYRIRRLRGMTGARRWRIMRWVVRRQ